MTIHIVGANGFIGKNLCSKIASTDVVNWSHSPDSNSRYFDLYDKNSWLDLFQTNLDIVVFLAWPGLPNYNETFHLVHVLPACIEFFQALVKNGCSNLIIAGTCYEYGLVNGSLDESMPTNPINYYAIAKDALRRFIFNYASDFKTRVVWARLFYPFGVDQNSKSLYPSLIHAIQANQKFFNISSGRQIRDFIAISTLIDQLLLLIKSPNAAGIFNCGSGNPQSIFEFVEKQIKSHDSDLIVRRGFYNDRLDEPVAFWANMSKFTAHFPQYKDISIND